MCLISIFLLLSIPSVFGEFEQILNRQYDPYIETKKLIEYLWEQGAVKRNWDAVDKHITSELIFYDVDGNRDDETHFIGHFLFELNTSITPEIFDIQSLDRQKVVYDTNYLKTDVIRASVQWGGHYLMLQFYKDVYDIKGNRYIYLPLTKVRVFKTKRDIGNGFYEGFSNNIVNAIVNNHTDIFDSTFTYQTCEHKTITNGYRLIPDKILQLPIVLDFIHYYRNKPGDIAQHLVQFKVITMSCRTHLFEVDYLTRKVLRGIEHSCEVGKCI